MSETHYINVPMYRKRRLRTPEGTQTLILMTDKSRLRLKPAINLLRHIWTVNVYDPISDRSYQLRIPLSPFKTQGSVAPITLFVKKVRQRNTEHPFRVFVASVLADEVTTYYEIDYQIVPFFVDLENLPQ